MSASTQQKRSFLQIMKAVFTDRQSAAMLILGLASGLPYVAVGGTLNAWLSTTDVKMSEIGLLSWTALAYTFKFMWAAALQKRKTPFNLNIGPRRFWMFVFIIPITLLLFSLSYIQPPNGLAMIGLIGLIIAVFSASFDMVLAAWRIESARDDSHLDLLSTIEQLGYRFTSILGGFVAFILADKIGWDFVYQCAAALMAVSALGIVLARPVAQIRRPIGEKDLVRVGKHLDVKTRNWATGIVLVGWAISLVILGQFMFGSLIDPSAHSPRDFMKGPGLIVIALTVILLAVVAAYLARTEAAKSVGYSGGDKAPTREGVIGILYGAIIEPMTELFVRHKNGAILIIAVVMTYRFTDLIWGSFAYPFYLGENFGALGHSLTEVGVASKLVGVFAIMFGIVLGGALMLRFGRMPILFIGGVLAAATNFLFADLAVDAAFMDGFLSLTRFDVAVKGITDFLVNSLQVESVPLDQRMLRLITAIFMENIAVGIASAASIAYLSSVVNKEYALTQYALLASITFLLGIIGRPLVGDIIEERGFAYAFILCGVLGFIAVIFVVMEWIRLSRLKP